MLSNSNAEPHQPHSRLQASPAANNPSSSSHKNTHNTHACSILCFCCKPHIFCNSPGWIIPPSPTTHHRLLRWCSSSITSTRMAPHPPTRHTHVLQCMCTIAAHATGELPLTQEGGQHPSGGTASPLQAASQAHAWYLTHQLGTPTYHNVCAQSLLTQQGSCP